MLLAVLLLFGGVAPAGHGWAPAPDGRTAAATQPAHDLISGRGAALRVPAVSAPVPWAVVPVGSGFAAASRLRRVDPAGVHVPAVATPTSRSTRAPPSSVS
ncbi:hypothetical protein ACIA5G_43755 [Amycolatopsis sp. NPDC051758]|uniref:hypothetical protein n=1 Tax=Amycolatopsis sp. NPDC051758 TaxID=3363935 RepID=UPI0037B1BD59